jgi:hypothetical protein
MFFYETVGYWKKARHSPEVGKTEPLFRDSWDYGNPKVKKSENWHVWRNNGPFVEVGKLEGENREAEIGVVLAPSDVVYRMRTGKYDFPFAQRNKPMLVTRVCYAFPSNPEHRGERKR